MSGLLGKYWAQFLGCAAVGMLSLCWCLAPANAAVLMDDFSTFHDYSGGAVQGIWDGTHNMANLAGGAYISNGDFVSEDLTVDDNNVTNVGWEGGRSTAPMLFVDVDPSEDFTAKVKITSQTSGFWSAAGLLARAKVGTGPGTGADNDDEHFVTFTTFRTDDAAPDTGNTLMKRIENGSQLSDINLAVNAGDEPLPLWLRLERGSFDNAGTPTWGYQGAVSSDGTTWQIQSTVFPTPGSPLYARNDTIEVGIVYQNYGGSAGTTTFDDFMLETRPGVPEPASLGLAALALLGGYGLVRRRKC